MADIVSPKVRSRMMSGIKGKNTKPEMLLRKALHAKGFRFRIHVSNMPGKPDIVLKRYKAVIFVHGCFWHQHNCHLFKWPSTRQNFWKQKITRNQEKDRENNQILLGNEWRVCIVWECSLKGRTRLSGKDVTERCIQWLEGNSGFEEITGVE